MHTLVVGQDRNGYGHQQPAPHKGRRPHHAESAHLRHEGCAYAPRDRPGRGRCCTCPLSSPHRTYLLSYPHRTLLKIGQSTADVDWLIFSPHFGMALPPPAHAARGNAQHRVHGMRSVSGHARRRQRHWCVPGTTPCGRFAPSVGGLTTLSLAEVRYVFACGGCFLPRAPSALSQARGTHLPVCATSTFARFGTCSAEVSMTLRYAFESGDVEMSTHGVFAVCRFPSSVAVIFIFKTNLRRTHQAI